MKLSVIIPCYNEEKNVGLFHSEFCKDFKKYKGEYELIFVNDGSKDKTVEELKKIVDKGKNIKVVSFSRNFGKEAAMYAGLREASGDFVSIIDADLQQRPSVLLDMVNILEENDDYDCVCAYQDVRREGFVLSFFKNCFYKLINKISDVNFVRGASDFRVFRKSVKDAMIEMHETHRFTKGIFAYVGFNTHYIPYEAEERANGNSKWSFKSLFKYAMTGILSFSTFPLKIATYLGGLTILGAFIYLITALVLKVKILTMMMFFLITFFSGIQLLVIGVLSQYISLMYDEIKNRQIYIAKEIFISKNYKK